MRDWVSYGETEQANQETERADCEAESEKEMQALRTEVKQAQAMEKFHAQH